MDNSFQQLISSDTPVLVDFYAEWCGPCKMMAPAIQEVASKIRGKAKVIKVDIDKNPQAAAAYGIQAVPTLIIFKAGKPVWRQSGVVPTHILEKQLLSFAV